MTIPTHRQLRRRKAAIRYNLYPCSICRLIRALSADAIVAAVMAVAIVAAAALLRLI